MTWKELLAEKRVEPHKTSKRELDALRSAINRNLHDAAVPQLSADNRFGLAYEAALLTAKMAVACDGHRVKGQGAHQTMFAALKLAVDSSVAKTASYLERCRRKRNELSYDTAGVVTDTEADEILAQAQALQKTIEEWIAQNHPRFA
jgi:uncharacterized protein (UPF0332 family)